MTTITKTDRTAAIAAILKATFEPRFTEFQRLLTEAVKNRVNEHFPKFKDWLADPELGPHIKAQHNFEPMYYNELAADQVYFKRPTNWTEEAEKCRQHTPCSWDDAARDIKASTAVPTTGRPEGFYIFNDLAPVYLSIWEDLIAAASKLRGVFGAYKAREKFEVDFPDLAKYLPAKITVSSSTAVRLNPVDVMKDLAAMGIPPETKDEPAYAES